MKKLFWFVFFVLLFVLVMPVHAQGTQPASQPVTVEFVIGIAAAVLSLLFTYWPSLRAWYDQKHEDVQRQIMAAVVVLVSVGLLALSCSGLAADFGIGLTCDKPSAIELIKIVFSALAVNQVTFMLTKKKSI